MVTCNFENAVKEHKKGNVTVIVEFYDNAGNVRREKVASFLPTRKAVKIFKCKQGANIIYSTKFFVFTNANELMKFINEDLTKFKVTDKELNEIF